MVSVYFRKRQNLCHIVQQNVKDYDYYHYYYYNVDGMGFFPLLRKTVYL